MGRPRTKTSKAPTNPDNVRPSTETEDVVMKDAEDVTMQDVQVVAEAQAEEGEETYNEDEDSDFDGNTTLNADPDAASSSGSSSSEVEPEVSKGKGKGRHQSRGSKGKEKGFVGKGKKIGKEVAEAEDVGFENSGDEGIIHEGIRKKNRRKGKGKKGAKGVGDAEEIDSDEGGEGGFVKTRRMRAEMQEERKKAPLASATGATIDVDALWESMMSKPAGYRGPSPSSLPSATEVVNKSQSDLTSKQQAATDLSISRNEALDLEKPASDLQPQDEETITIDRTYDFAGETVHEQKTVLKSSAEAKLYLQSLEQTKPQHRVLPSKFAATADHPALRRPLRRIMRYDPNPSGIIEGVLPKTKAERNAAKSINRTSKAPKMNVVTKSGLDWAGLVDKEGLKDELDAASKAKGDYLERQDFMGRTDARRDEEMRSARIR